MNTQRVEKKATNERRKFMVVTCAVVFAVMTIGLVYVFWHGTAAKDDIYSTTDGNSTYRLANSISDLSEEIKTPRGLDNTVVQLSITNPNEIPERRTGHCSGVLLQSRVVATAAHCINMNDINVLQVSVSPALYQNSQGQVITPFGTCSVGDFVSPYQNKEVSVGTDVVLLGIKSCTATTGQQDSSLRNIGNLTGTAVPYVQTDQAWWGAPHSKLLEYGYPDVDQKGDATIFTKLYKLPTSKGGYQDTVLTQLGSNVRVWNEKMSSGASGGPLFEYRNNRWVLVALATRLENHETTGQWVAASGSGITQVVVDAAKKLNVSK